MLPEAGAPSAVGAGQSRPAEAPVSAVVSTGDYHGYLRLEALTGKGRAGEGCPLPARSHMTASASLGGVLSNVRAGTREDILPRFSRPVQHPSPSIRSLWGPGPEHSQRQGSRRDVLTLPSICSVLGGQRDRKRWFLGPLGALGPRRGAFRGQGGECSLESWGYKDHFLGLGSSARSRLRSPPLHIGCWPGRQDACSASGYELRLLLGPDFSICKMGLMITNPPPTSSLWGGFFK